MSLAEDVLAAIAVPVTSDEPVDVGQMLEDVLRPVGLRTADAGGIVSFLGADPVVPSTMRLGAAASIGLVAKSVAIAKLWQTRGGAGQDITMDLRVAPHRLCPFYDQRWELLNGYPQGASSNPSNALGFMFHRTKDDQWVMPLNPYPKIKLAAQNLLGVPDDVRAVRKAIRTWRGADLEIAGAEAGVVMPLLRTTQDMLAEPQFTDVLAGLPLIEITKIGDSDPEPLPAGATSPLDGVRALGMGHVIAGAGCGRALALHGAEVLNVWRPDELEHDATYVTANVGVRSCTLNPTSLDGSARLQQLLAGADIFYANRRPGYLDRIGLGAEQAAATRPGIIHATASLHGESGPWVDRIGFDQTAGSVVGMLLREGGGTVPSLPPILVVNDYIVSWLMTVGIVEALMRRAQVGGSYRVHVSLTRVALWILSLGVFDRDYAAATAGRPGEHAYLDPEQFSAETPLGSYTGVTDQVRMSVTPGSYREVLVPRGSCRPEWLGADRPPGRC